MQQPEQGQEVAAASSLPALELRPLSTGELLDRAFFLYRARFTWFLALALVPAGLGLLSGAVQQVLAPAATRFSTSNHPAGLSPYAGVAGLALLCTSLLALAGYAVLQAATTRLVAEIYLSGSGSPATALRQAWPRTWRYILIELWKAWSAAWLFVLMLAAGLGLIASKQAVSGEVLLAFSLPAMVYGVIAYLRNSLAVPASVLEALPVRAAMRRSKVLVSGRKWRIFLLYLLLMLLYAVALGVQSPVLLYLAKARAPVQHVVAVILTLGLSFVITLLISPVASIALCLFYFDERVRREAFDIDFLLRGADATLHAIPQTAAETPGTGATGFGASPEDR